MTNEEQHVPGANDDSVGDEQHGSEVPAAGPEANASGPVPQEGDLTVEDILNSEQNAAAADADATEAVDPANDEANPYLEDLRRLSAEYANYRKRTEANVGVEKQRALAAAVSPLLPILDDLDRAEQHGDLVEGSAFNAIAQKLRGTLEKFGVVSYGEKGDLFDPQLHEAIAQVPVPGTEQDTVLDVIERGYRLGDLELRPAKVAVAVGADG
ncbi:molecular chaperone GrpE [Leucobacter exalbidus]|uniref:Protein GrpE n=1 Tax=Leucobacter exalbidus TaxID=662960 RepID=A0A940PU82_9MICO|nr:nucleotide exchange factor GrpE [Leucobacter exalbidus]MBP1326908.1 molecular chaperone GrpE [Leucobacter exalbidus]